MTEATTQTLDIDAWIAEAGPKEEAAVSTEETTTPTTPATPPEGEETTAGEATEAGVDTDQPVTEGEAGEDQLEEVEWEGKTVRVAPEIKAALMRTADYTRKTQEIANTRKELEAREARLAEQTEAAQAFQEERTQLWAYDRQLKAFENLDLDKVEEEEGAEAANKLFRQHQQLKDARAKLASTVEAKVKEQELETQRKAEEARTSAIQELHSTLKQDIPGWSPKVAQEVATFGMETFGFTPGELKEVLDPRLIKLLHTAHQGQAAIQREAAAKTLTDTKTVQPVTPPGGNTPNARKTTDASGDGLDVAEWMRLEDEREAQRRRR